MRRQQKNPCVSQIARQSLKIKFLEMKLWFVTTKFLEHHLREVKSKPIFHQNRDLLKF